MVRGPWEGDLAMISRKNVAYPKLVSFDLFNTLVAERSDVAEAQRVQALMEPFLAFGGPVPDLELVRLLVQRAELDYRVSWWSNTAHSPTKAACDIAEALCRVVGLDAELNVAGTLADNFLRCGGSAELALVPGAGELVSALARRQVALCLVSDVGLTPSPILVEFLDAQGLFGLFGSYSFSDVTAVYKPAAEAFEAAWSHWGDLEVSQIWHVGDMRRSDVVGARQLGATTVRYAGVYDDHESSDQEADLVVTSMEGLSRALRGAS